MKVLDLSIADLHFVFDPIKRIWPTCQVSVIWDAPVQALVVRLDVRVGVRSYGYVRDFAEYEFEHMPKEYVLERTRDERNHAVRELTQLMLADPHGTTTRRTYGRS